MQIFQAKNAPQNALFIHGIQCVPRVICEAFPVERPLLCCASNSWRNCSLSIVHIFIGFVIGCKITAFLQILQYAD